MCSSISPVEETNPPQENNDLRSATGSPVPKNWLGIISVIWSGQAFSIVSSYAAGYTALWYITDTTNSAMMLAIATIVSVLPTGILSPFGGVLADRFNRRTIMLISDAGVGLLSALLGIIILLGQTDLILIMVIIFCRAVAQAFHAPAMTAAMPMLVPEEHLVRINSLNQMMWSAAGIGAPALGIFLYSSIGFHAVMFLDAAGALLACAGLALAHIPTVRDETMEGQHVLRNLADGFKVIRNNEGLFQLMVFCTIAMLVFMPVGSLFPLMTKEHFGGDGYQAAMIEAAFGAAMLIGSIVLMAWGGGKKHIQLVIFSGLGVGITTLGSGLLPPQMFWIFAGLSALMGFVCAFYNGPLMTVIQRHSPEEKMGRVMGLFGSIMSLVSPIGLVVAGFGAEYTGIASWFVISGILMLILTIIPLTRKAILDLDAPR